MPKTHKGNHYELSVFLRLLSGGVVVHVYEVVVDQPIAWVKAHADELAKRLLSGAVQDYCALMVTEAGQGGAV